MAGYDLKESCLLEIFPWRHESHLSLSLSPPIYLFIYLIFFKQVVFQKTNKFK